MTPQQPASLLEQHRSLKECVSARIHGQRGGVAAVAGKLDLSPSHLSEVLGGGSHRHRKFDLDDLEKYVSTYRDVTPILYLVAKYLPDEMTAQTAALEQLSAIAARLPGLMAAAGIKP